ncbi:hypothetical protein XENOCAPTIV_002658, partial [Xenoophorus captivus]
VSAEQLSDAVGRTDEVTCGAVEQLERLLFVLHTLVSHRGGAKVTKPETICKMSVQLIESSFRSASCSRLLLQITSSLLLGENISLPNVLIQETVQKLFLPSLLRFTAGLFGCGNATSRHSALDVLVSLILAKAPPPTDGSMAFETYPLLFTSQNIRLDITSRSFNWFSALFVARQALSCLLSLDCSAQLLSLVSVDKVYSVLRRFPTDVSALLLGDLYHTRLSLSGVSEHLSHSALLEIYEMLHSNLSSNVSKDYREKLLHLRKLRHDLVQRSLPRGPPGTFPQDFWRVFYEHLEMVAELAEKELDVTDEDDREEDSGPRDEAGCDVIESGDVGVLFLDQLKLTSNPDERTDFPNFRSLLWRAMAQFPDRVEPRSRELSPLLLRFIRSVLQQTESAFLKLWRKDLILMCISPAGMSFILPTCWLHQLKT